MKVLHPIKAVDHEKEQSERQLSLSDFLESYNSNIPSSFPLASSSNLKAFQGSHASLFKETKNSWSLDRHRKKFMDWLPQHIKSLEQPVS